MEASTKKLEDWFSLIREGGLRLPRFQRFEAWGYWQIEAVLENILQDPSLPIGALLTLDVGDKELFISRPIVSAPDYKNKKPQMHLLDGQQRMTAIWRALNATYDKMDFFVSLEEPKKPDVITIKRYINKNNLKMPLWADDPVETYARDLIPLPILCPGADGEALADQWSEKAQTDKQTDKLIAKWRGRVGSYSIPYLSLPSSTEQETALNVFINMNTSASPLKDFDIVVAQLEGAVGGSLHEMVDQILEECPQARAFGNINDYALSIGALLLDKTPLKKTYLDPEVNFGQGLAEQWPNVEKGIKSAVAFLIEEGIFNQSILPSEVIFYLSAALWAHVDERKPDQAGFARDVIRQTIWRAAFSDRYNKTVTTRAFADYRELKKLVKQGPNAGAPELFSPNYAPLPSADELKTGGWPKKKDRLGRAILALSLRNGGFDFADGSKASFENVGTREYHHIYPKSLLEDFEPRGLINSSLNCALISWATNRKIAAKTPAEYIAERAKDAKASEEEVKLRLQSHQIPVKALQSGDFIKFINKRAQKIHKAMLKLCNETEHQ